MRERTWVDLEDEAPPMYGSEELSARFWEYDQCIELLLNGDLAGARAAVKNIPQPAPREIAEQQVHFMDEFWRCIQKLNEPNANGECWAHASRARRIVRNNLVKSLQREYEQYLPTDTDAYVPPNPFASDGLSTGVVSPEFTGLPVPGRTNVDATCEHPCKIPELRDNEYALLIKKLGKESGDPYSVFSVRTLELLQSMSAQGKWYYPLNFSLSCKASSPALHVLAHLLEASVVRRDPPVVTTFFLSSRCGYEEKKIRNHLQSMKRMLFKELPIDLHLSDDGIVTFSYAS